MAKPSVEDYIIDFSKEESGGGGGGRHYKEGTYRFKIVSATETTASQKGTVGLEVKLKFMEGKYKGKELVERLWSTPKVYPRFRSLMEACGLKVPQRFDIRKLTKALKGKELYCEIVDDEQEGYKTRSVVAWNGFISVDDYEDVETDEEEEEEEEDDELEEDDLEEDEEEEEEEAPAAKKKSRKKSKPKPADDDEDEDLEELDLDDL